MEKKGKRKVKIKSIMFLFVIIIFTCCCIFIFTKKDSILIEKKEKGYLASSTYTIDLYEYLKEEEKESLEKKDSLVRGKEIKYFPDSIITYEDKEYLKKCLEIIKYKLKNEYKLDINKNKTMITSCKEGINFLGYNFKVINNKTIISLSQSSKKNIKKGIKRNKYFYNRKMINFNQLFSSIENYKYSYKYCNYYEIKNIFDRYF